MNERLNNNSSEITMIQQPKNNASPHKTTVEDNSKQQNQIQTLNKKNKRKNNEMLSKSLIKEKLPESMKFFLKNKRIISNIQKSSIKQKQSIKINKKPTLQPLQITNDSILQHSMTNFDKKNKELFNQSKLENKKISDRIVYPQITSKCTICEGYVQKSMLKNKAFNCQHIFCSDCTKNYIFFKISRFELISCPNQNCQQLLDKTSNFYNELDLKERKRYKIIQNFYKLNKQNKKMCPKQDCEGIIELNKNELFITCKFCKQQFCSKCYSKKHEGQCINYETQYMIKSLNLVECQKCRNFIEKTEGCHHITCKCGFEFCEKCKQIWKKSHICKYTMLDRAEQGWGGCDWGLTTKDHMYFLLKIPLKLFLVIMCTLSWFLFSFLGVPLNLIMISYWFYMLLIKPTIQMIKRQEQLWKIVLYVVFFVFFIIKNICVGVQYLMQHLNNLLPQIPNSYRWIMRL